MDAWKFDSQGILSGTYIFITNEAASNSLLVVCALVRLVPEAFGGRCLLLLSAATVVCLSS